MAITINEKPESRQYTKDGSYELIYLIKGTADEAAAMTALESEAPATANSLTRKKCRVVPVEESFDASTAANCYYIGTAPYAKSGFTQREPMNAGENVYTFDTTGGMVQKFQAESKIQTYMAGSVTEENYKGAMGVSGTIDDPNVAGISIVVPVYKFSETWVKANADVTGAYKAILRGLTGKTNNATFKGAAECECLFLGAAGTTRGDDEWQITYSFLFSDSVTGKTVGDITNINKKGFEYMDVKYHMRKGSKSWLSIPKQIDIFRIYDAGDFSTKGIGTT